METSDILIRISDRISLSFYKSHIGVERDNTDDNDTNIR